MEFRILGRLMVLDDAGQPVTIKGHRAAQILAFLLLHPNQPISITRLIQALWDEPPPAARQSVHYFIHQLRKYLGAAGDKQALATTAGGYQLGVTPEQIDARCFDRLVTQARTTRDAGDLAGAAELFGQALGLWYGTALSDFAEEPFAEPFIAQLEEQRLLALEDQFDVGLELGQHIRLAGELDALVHTHPQRERLHGLRMLALYRSGRQAEALDAYQFARKVLLESAGLQPGVELQRLQRGILAHDPSLDLPEPQPQRVAARTPSPPAARLNPLVNPLASTPAAAQPATPQPPVPPASPPTQRRDERRLVTALVVGIAAEPTTGGDPEEVREQTAAVMDRIAERTGRYGGVVQAVEMGRLLALFGAERSREDDPERAVRAALEIVSAETSGEEPDVPTRAGVATGEVVVIHHPDADSADEITGGDVEHLAVTLEQAARPGTVVVGSSTYQATSRTISHTPIDPPGMLRLAGGRRLWQAVAPRARTGAHIVGKARTPLVERDRELAMLQDVLTRFLQHREPQFVTLVSDPGLGKTRLVGELGRLVDASPELIGWRIGHARSYDQGALGALAEIIQAEAGIQGGDDAQTAERKLQQAVLDTTGDSEQAAQVTASLWSLVGASEVEQLSSQRDVLFDDWAQFIGALADRRPLVAVFEDLQRAEDVLLEFVEHLPERVGSVPLLVVCTSRPELLARRPGWGGGKRSALAISLPPLTREGTGVLLDTLLAEGQERLPEPTRKTVLKASGGNPLYVEEYVHMLREQAPYPQTPPDGGGLPIPQGVRQVIAARIDTLPHADKLLLQAAAVLGEVGWVGALSAVSGWKRAEVEAGLAQLQRGDLLRRVRSSSVAEETEYVFRHNLVREVAYRQILRGDRARMHHRAAKWIEARYPDTGGRVELLAHHYRQALTLSQAAGQPAGELAQQTRLLLRAAGDRAGAVCAFGVAARAYRDALELWPTDDPELPELQLRLGQALVFGQHTGQDILTQAQAGLLAAGREDQAAQAGMLLSQLAVVHGSPTTTAHEHTQRWLADQDEPKPTATLATVTALGSRAIQLLVADRHTEALAAARQLITLARHLHLPDHEGNGLSLAGHIRLLAGDPGGLEESQRGQELMEANQFPLRVFSYFGHPNTLYWFGDLERCAAALHHGRDAVRALDAAVTSWFDAVQAALDWAAGRLSSVLTITEQAITRQASDNESDRDRDRFLLPWHHALRGQARLASGDVTGALRDAQTGLKVATAADSTRYRHLTLALLTRALLAAGRRAEAAGRLEELLADQRKQPAASCATPDLAITLIDLDHPAGALPAGLPPTRWHQAVQALVARDFPTAVTLLDEIGSPLDAAQALLCQAGELARTRTAPDQARAALELAAERFGQAGATGHLQTALRLLAEVSGGQPTSHRT